MVVTRPVERGEEGGGEFSRPRRGPTVAQNTENSVPGGFFLI